MRILLSSLLLLAIASQAVAQTQMSGSVNLAPTSTLPMVYSPPQTPPGGPQPMPRGQAPSPFAPPAAQSPFVHDFTFGSAPAVPCFSAPGCEHCLTCVREETTKTIRHYTYCKTCEEFCIPTCGCCLGSLFGGCSHCEGPYVKYYLIKKTHTEVCPTTKCVPAVVAPCVTAPGPQANHYQMPAIKQ